MQIVADRDLPIALDHHVSFAFPGAKGRPGALRAANRQRGEKQRDRGIR